MAARRNRGRNRRTQDSYGHRARREGYAARSVYKLEEIDRRLSLLRRGKRVLDLGAFPGSWTQYAADRVGREGRVVGIDLQEFAGELPPQAEMRAADVLTLDPSTLGTFDVVLSDMAPSTSGQRHADQFRSTELYLSALRIAAEVLAPGGTFVGKIFQGAEFEDAREQTRQRFARVRVLRPRATRDESYELYLVGLDRR